jgi:transposase InsO family protein/DNA-binding transcriptional regulator YiaG
MKRRCLDTLALHALMKATHLLGLALGERLRQYRDSGDRVLDRFASLQEQLLHVATLREAVEIHGSRWDKLPERQRPHYAPEARFRIVRLKNLLALSAAETARLFRVSTNTVQRWEDEVRAAPGGDTVGSLLKPTPPVRRYADVVRHLIQTMTLAAFPGDRSIALHLARVGWKLSRRTVQRIRHEKPVLSPMAPPISRSRVVRAKYPSHVWMLDLTEIPGFLRLFSFKLAVVFDVFSRAPLAARVFFQEPTGRDMARFLTRAAHRFGPPRHAVSDQGPQFKSGPFLSALARLGIRHRYGAIGRTGSISLIERFFRTLKTIAGLRGRPPLLRRDLEKRLGLTFLYYLWLRPHQALAGATPAEVHLGLKINPASVSLPRGRPGEQRRPVSVVPGIHYLDPEKRLPYLLNRAA